MIISAAAACRKGAVPAAPRLVRRSPSFSSCSDTNAATTRIIASSRRRRARFGTLMPSSSPLVPVAEAAGTGMVSRTAGGSGSGSSGCYHQQLQQQPRQTNLQFAGMGRQQHHHHQQHPIPLRHSCLTTMETVVQPVDERGNGTRTDFSATQMTTFGPFSLVPWHHHQQLAARRHLSTCAFAGSNATALVKGAASFSDGHGPAVDSLSAFRHRSSSSSPSSSGPSSAPGGPSDGIGAAGEKDERGQQVKHRRSLRERATERASDIRANAKARATAFRDDARVRYEHVRENPRESAVSGAKSFGAMLRQYGPVFVGTYMGVYFTTLGLLFAGVESGVMDPVSLFGWIGAAGADGETKTTVEFVVQFMESHSLTKPYAPVVERNPEFANLAAAWVAVKFTEPVRFPIAVAITPKIARTFGFAAAKVDESVAAEEGGGGEDAAAPSSSSNDGADSAERSSVKEKAPKA